MILNNVVNKEDCTPEYAEIKDYKFFCFNGEPKFLYLSEFLNDHEKAKISFLNTDWTFAEYQRSDYAPFTTLPEKPKNFDKMLEVARKLSKGIPHVRVDLYNINGRIYFGELTFFTNSGFVPFVTEEMDKDMGKYLLLPKKL